jgi:hypothetical protein
MPWPTTHLEQGAVHIVFVGRLQVVYHGAGARVCVGHCSCERPPTLAYLVVLRVVRGLVTLARMAGGTDDRCCVLDAKQNQKSM